MDADLFERGFPFVAVPEAAPAPVLAPVHPVTVEADGVRTFRMLVAFCPDAR